MSGRRAGIMCFISHVEAMCGFAVCNPSMGMVGEWEDWEFKVVILGKK